MRKLVISVSFKMRKERTTVPMRKGKRNNGHPFSCLMYHYPNSKLSLRTPLLYSDCQAGEGARYIEVQVCGA